MASAASFIFSGGVGVYISILAVQTGSKHRRGAPANFQISWVRERAIPLPYRCRNGQPAAASQLQAELGQHEASTFRKCF